MTVGKVSHVGISVFFLSGVGSSDLGKTPAYENVFNGPMDQLEELYDLKLCFANFKPNTLMSMLGKAQGTG